MEYLKTMHFEIDNFTRNFLPLLTYFSGPFLLEVYTLLKRLVLLLPTQVEGQSIDGIMDSDHTKP